MACVRARHICTSRRILALHIISYTRCTRTLLRHGNAIARTLKDNFIQKGKQQNAIIVYGTYGSVCARAL